MDISEPAVLARLPRSVQGSPDVQFGHSWGWRSGVKRKRHEICCAVSGTGVNIYEAQSGRILMSHAVPPTAIFSGAPCSLRWKEQDVACRQTCFVTSDHGHRLNVVTTKGTGNTEKLSLELAASSSPVTHLDISRREQSTSITILQRDGTITVGSADLKAVVVGKVSLKEEATTNILEASILDLASARKSVLKARADLIGTLSPEAQVVVFATGSLDASQEKRTVRYAAYSLVSSLSGPNKRLELSHLFEHNLTQLSPTLVDAGFNVEESSFGPRHTFLDIRISPGLIRFDLQAPTPRPSLRLSDVSTGLESYVAISQSHALASYPGRLRVLDVNYSTIQTSQEQNRKRKRHGPDVPAQPKLICYFSQINRVLARDGLRLLAIDINYAESASGNKNSSSTLADNVGLGSASRSCVATDLLLAEELMDCSMLQNSLPSDWKQSLGDMLDRDDVSGFEDFLFKSLYLDGKPQNKASGLSDEVATFILSKMFSAQASTPDQTYGTRLRLNFTAPRILEALNGRGFVRMNQLRKAFRFGKEQAGTQLRHDDIAKALQNADPSLDLLSSYVRSDLNPDIYEETLLLRFLVQQVLVKGTAAQQPRLLAAESSEEMAVEALTATQTAEDSSDLSILEACLTAVMERYGHFDLLTVSTSIRSILSNDEIFGVVQLLRQQMFRGGHTGSLLVASQNTSPPQEQRVSLESAVTILSACLDAIGPLDLVGGNDADELVERIVPDLLSEITLATQYLEESADLQGILRETLRYAEFQQPRARDLPRGQGQKVHSGQTGEIVTLYAQRTEDEDVSSVPGALPLSLRSDEAIKAVKMRKGGGQLKERSERETLMLQNRQKGPYTFERLAL